MPRTTKPKSPKVPKYPCRDLYAKIYEARLGCECWAEWRFHPVRKWRFDYAFPKEMVAVEIDGGLFIGGRHSGGMGQKRDFEKLNAAAEMGWRVFHFTPGERLKTTTLTQLHNALKYSSDGTIH